MERAGDVHQAEEKAQASHESSPEMREDIYYGRDSRQVLPVSKG